MEIKPFLVLAAILIVGAVIGFTALAVDLRKIIIKELGIDILECDLNMYGQIKEMIMPILERKYPNIIYMVQLYIIFIFSLSVILLFDILWLLIC